MLSQKYIKSLCLLITPIILCFAELSWSEPVIKNLNTFNTEEFKKEKKLNIELKNLPACHIGDLDLIRRELMTSKEPAHLVLTIEPISPTSTIKPVAVKFPRGGDGNVSVTLDEKMVGQALGMFICKITDGLPLTCADKKSTSFEEMYKPYEGLIEKHGLNLGNYDIEKIPVSDKVYYFTPVFLDSTGLTSFSDRPSEGTFKELSEKFSFKKGEFESLKKRDLTIQSIPPLFEDDRIVIRLPSFNPAKCVKQ